MNATNIATNALAAIKRSGTTFTLTRQTVTTAGATPWKKSGASDATHTLNGMLDDYRDAERDGEIVRLNDRRYLVAASDLSVVPQPTDTLTDGSTKYEIVAVNTIRAKSTDVCYYLHARN